MVVEKQQQQQQRVLFVVFNSFSSICEPGGCVVFFVGCNRPTEKERERERALPCQSWFDLFSHSSSIVTDVQALIASLQVMNLLASNTAAKPGRTQQSSHALMSGQPTPFSSYFSAVAGQQCIRGSGVSVPRLGMMVHHQ